MKDTFNDACVVGWVTLKLSLNLPDPDDNHFVAAALLGRADVIVTNNLKDFPDRELGRFNLSAQRPDEFLLNQLDLAPDRVMRALAQQAADMQDPPRTVRDVLDSLERAGANSFAAECRKQLWRAQ